MVENQARDFTITHKVKKTPIKRRQEREFVLQMLFAGEFNSEPLESQIRLLDDFTRQKATPFARKLIKICQEKKDLLDTEIINKLDNWDFNRIAVIDKLILRMAISELIFFEEIPAEVSINEAIELGKEFSTEQSGKFINGILDAILKKLKSENKI